MIGFGSRGPGYGNRLAFGVATILVAAARMELANVNDTTGALSLNFSSPLQTLTHTWRFPDFYSSSIEEP
jgi:hypothetical protein